MSRSLQLGLRTGDLFQTPAVPRSCVVQITNIQLNSPSDHSANHASSSTSSDEVHYSLAFQASSRRVLSRVDEIHFARSVEQLESQFEQPLNVSFEYQHYTKNRVNSLYMSLQKRKKYRARAVSGYKTLARAQINLDEIVQCPPMLPLRVKLFHTEKETKENKQIEVGSVLVSAISTQPTEDVKYDSSDTEDEENTLQESQKSQQQQKGVASRVKSVRMLKKFIEKVLSQQNRPNDPDNENMEIDINDIQDLNIDDFQLYDELDEYGISDEDEDFYPINEQNDDTISFASTPRPNIKPYFDTTSQCSFQPRLPSTTGPLLDKVDEDLDHQQKEQPKVEDLDSTTTDQDAIATTESTAFDTTEEMIVGDDKKNKKTSKKIKRLPYRAQKSTESNEESHMPLTVDQNNDLAESVDTSRLLVFAVRTQRNQSIIDRIISMSGKNDKICIFDLDKDSLAEAMHVVVKRIHQINLKHKLKEPVRICVCGGADSFNQMIKVYLDEMGKRSAEWNAYFSFIFIATDHHHQDLATTKYFGDSCEQYRQAFCDSGDWTANSDHLSANFELLLTDALHTHTIPVGEALLTFIDESTGTQQLFVPFCVEVLVTENDTYDNSDSDCEDRAQKTLSPTASPFSSSQQHQSANVSYSSSEKLQLCIDYWSEDKEGKQSAKETLRSIEFVPLKQYIKMDMVIRPKRVGINRLPGRKHHHPGDSAPPKIKTEHVKRAICKSRNAIEKSKIAKISIDGVDYRDISYFQISKLTAAGCTKTFPISLFTPVQT